MINLPIDFLNRMEKLLKNDYDKFLLSYDQNKFAALRVNTLKLSVDEFIKLTNFDIEKVEWVEEGFYYNMAQSPGKHPYHFAGLYYIQEPSAMSVAKVLDAQPGERVLDLCAAPGGKSTQIACGMKGQGLLVSNEIVSSRATILAENMERFGVKNAIITNESPERLSKHFNEYFDKILVDAPCSGEGMFRKDPKACSEWSLQGTLSCAKRQIGILEEAASMLKPGGILVYSTCTFAPEENEGAVEEFLEQHPEFELLSIPNLHDMDHGRPEWVNGREDLTKSMRIWPHLQKGEGHFVARLQKNGDLVSIEREERLEKSKLNIEPYLQFQQEFITWECNGSFIQFGEQLYSMPVYDLELKGLKVIRPGLHLGALKKNRFEPSHTLAMALSQEQFRNSVNFTADQQEVTKYLRGETIDVDIKNGWAAFLVDEYPLGWGKVVDGVMKNHFPRGLRVKF